MHALLITGDTYPNRRALRALGGVWQADTKGYALPLNRRADAEALPGLDVRETVFDGDPFAPLSPDALRAYRQARQDHRADRLRGRAALADARSAKASNRISKGEKEFLSLMEPVKVGHHSERRHRKLLARAQNSFMEAGKEAHYADQLRRRADYLQPARVAGDAARARQEANDAARDQFAVGDTVKDIILGLGVVFRVNAKTLTVRFNSGGTYTAEPRNLALIEKGTGALPKPVRLFKAGDAVLWHRHGRANIPHCKPVKATVQRATPKGYSITYTLTGLGGTSTHTARANEVDLEHATTQEG